MFLMNLLKTAAAAQSYKGRKSMPMAVAVVAAKRLLLVGSSLTLGDTLASGGSSTPPCELVQHAVVSTFDLFSIGIGPSSSHTVGPMRAAKIFVEDLEQGRVLERVSQMRVDLYGSLALTGKGHGTPEAILMGLEGEAPESINTKGIAQRVALIETDRVLNLRQSRRISFDPLKHLIFHYREALPQHPNGMRFSAFNSNGDIIATNEFFSIGGGFVVNEATRIQKEENVYYKDNRVDHVTEVKVDNASLNKIILNDKINIDAYNNNITASTTTTSTRTTTTPPSPPTSSSTDNSLIAAENKTNLITATLPFYNASSLLRVCQHENLSIAQVVFKNEMQWRSPEEVKARVLGIWQVMNESIENGIASRESYLPGPLKVKRRAPGIYKRLMMGLADYAGLNSVPQIKFASPSSRKAAVEGPTTPEGGGGRGGGGSDASSLSSSSLTSTSTTSTSAPTPAFGPARRPFATAGKRSLPALDWISLYAISVNEENAAGGRVVTAPTNGAAGVLPAVLKYYLDFICPSHSDFENDVVEYLLTAAAIGMLYKRAASISAAEMGCQGEVGVACSMAAGAFTAVMGGTMEQVENASEIAMEHNLGLTCDPIAGLVQIPCIERNALGAVKAITASQLALHGDGHHRVSLDQVIETMRQTGIDMQLKYKETSQGGLAVNVPVC